MFHPRVSVIIPTHNRAGFLREALASVRAQTVAEWECLVIDDGSTDETPALVSELASADPRVRYLHQQRFGRPSRARNLGVSSSTGELVAFLDDDDRWHPDKLERQLSALSTAGDGLVFAKIRKYGMKEQVWPTGRLPPRPSFAALAGGNFVPTSTALVRRRVLERVGLFNETYVAVEDYDLWLRVARVAGLRALPEVLCDYRVHPGGNSVQRRRDELRELEQIYDELEQRFGASPAELRAGRRKMHLRRAWAAGPLHALGHLRRALDP